MIRELTKRVKRLEDKTGEAAARLQIEKSIREIQEYLYCAPEKLEEGRKPIVIIARDPKGNTMQITDDEFEERFREEGLKFVDFA